MKDPTLFMQHRTSGNYAACIYHDKHCTVWHWAKNVSDAYAFKSRGEAKRVLRESFRHNTLEDVTFRRL